ncbi:MAG: hypothetical protein HN374_00210 [Cryomorphaceae bacterium]|nr:hypothetical protein [Cryomorphaceae bacterium]
MFGVLFLVVFMISGCELMQEDPQLASKFKAIGGGGSGGDPAIVCYDSDGGIDYEVKGTIFIDGQYHQEDKCTSPYDGSVIEWYCDGSMQMIRTFDCNYGCTDGACDTERYSGVLDMLNNCEVTEIQGAITTNCNDYCADLGKTCIKEDYLSYVGGVGWITDTETDCRDTYSINNTNAHGGEKLHCRCC